MCDSGIKLIKVRKTHEHALALYALLNARIHKISHFDLPTFEQHKQFFLSHPYRAWYLISQNNEFIGSIYLLKSNNIGVFAVSNYHQCVLEAIKQLLRKYKPLPAIRSVRAPTFSVNVAPTDELLICVLNELGGELSQQTYTLRK